MAGGKRGGVSSGIGWALGRLARLAYRRRWAALLIATAALVVAGWAARGLSVDTDLTKLLPRSFQSVRSLDELEKRSWGVGYVSVVARGADPDTLRQFANDVAPQLEKLSTIHYVDYRLPWEFFRDHALYYVDRADLEIALERIEQRRQWEVRKRSPLYDLGLEELGDPPPLDFDDLRGKVERRSAGIESRGQARAGYFMPPSGEMIVLLAKPSHRSSDVGFSDRVVQEVRAFVDGLDLSPYGSELRVELSGRYQKKFDQKRQIQSDLRLASLVALALMVAFLGIHFRRAGAVAYVMVPLITGLVLTFGLTAILFEKLNLLTGFIGAILLGLGIDHGIHLVARVDEERVRGGSMVEAVERAFTHTGRAVLIAALTTTVGFVGVALSEFRAFREFGVIAALGTVLIVLSYSVVLPALLSFGSSTSTSGGGTRKSSTFGAALPRWAPLTAWLSVLAIGASLAFVGENRFDYDFASLEDSRLPSFVLDKEINRLLGRSQTPLVVIPESIEHEQRIVKALRARQQERGSESTVQLVMSLSDLVPGEQQQQRAVIAELGESVAAVKAQWLTADQGRARDELLQMTDASPFERGDLPAEIRRQFSSAAGGAGFVLVFPSVSLSDGEGVRRLAAELRGVTLDDGSHLTIAGEAMVLADVLQMVVEEAPAVLGVTLALVAAVLAGMLGLSLALPCLLVAAATLMVTAGLMPRVGVRFNYLNIVMVPVLFGIAVDGAVHLLTRLRGGAGVVVATSETGRAIAGAVLTTSLGFGAMLLADHPGLRSLGALAVLGLAVNLIICLVAVPSLAVLTGRVSRSAAASGWTGKLARFGATVGMAGDSPVAPGTVGALVALPIALLLATLGTALRVLVVIAVVAVSFVIVGRYLRDCDDHDPSEVVLDELVGCLVAVVMVPVTVAWIAAAFVLFRVLDIAKPWPIGAIDRRLRGAGGVVGDDLAAGALAGAALFGLHWLGVARGWWVQ